MSNVCGFVLQTKINYEIKQYSLGTQGIKNTHTWKKKKIFVIANLSKICIKGLLQNSKYTALNSAAAFFLMFSTWRNLIPSRADFILGVKEVSCLVVKFLWWMAINTPCFATNAFTLMEER
jgi:hypothetical protein